METRKILYKGGQRVNPTLSERVRKDRGRRVEKRQEKFNLARQIQLDDSPVQRTKASDKLSKLREYRLNKNTKMIQDKQNQRSPFILSVPVGRWVEKKEHFPKARLDLNKTPIRNVLMSQRVLKRSTVKDIIAKSTVKKENVMIFTGSSKPQAVKSKKKILGEFNSIEQSTEEAEVAPLNDTFEVLPELDNELIDGPTSGLRRSNSLPEIARKITFKKVVKSSTPPIKAVAKEAPNRKPAMEVRQVVKSIKTNPGAASSSTTVAVRPKLVANKKAAKILKPIVPLAASRAILNPDVPTESETPTVEAVEPAKLADTAEVQKPMSKKKQRKRSQTFLLYDSMMNTQVKYLKLRLEEIQTDKETFIESLDEDKKMLVHVSIQQGQQLISEKLKKFAALLEQYEASLSSEDNPKIYSSEDIENYWYLLYDEIDETKKNLDKIVEMKGASKVSKRRSRRNYEAVGGTPKRSKRIAGSVDTPKHNASCYGCVTMSATKTNTPRSNKRRTTLAKKSIRFEGVPETPKGSSSRRSTKRSAATPKRNLIRMNAMDDDDDIDSNENLM